jgi:hypothetical protein
MFGYPLIPPGTTHFEIFEGVFESGSGVWLECVVRIDKAKERMREIAAQKQGSYFIYSCSTSSVLDKVGSGPKKANEEDHPKAGPFKFRRLQIRN